MYLRNNYLSNALEPLPVSAHERAVAAGRSGSFFFDTHIQGHNARVFTTEFQPGFAIQVAASLDAADHALSKIRLWLILVALGGIGIASAAGFLVPRAALRPVRRLSETPGHGRTTRDLAQ